MFPRKILIRERFRTINRRTPCPISIQEISSLNHEIFNLKCTVAYIYSLLALYRGKEEGKSGGGLGVIFFFFFIKKLNNNNNNKKTPPHGCVGRKRGKRV